MGKRPTVHESFIVRIWREEAPPAWRAWIQHTGSGESAVVRTVEELVTFLEQRAGKLDDVPPQGLK